MPFLGPVNTFTSDPGIADDEEEKKEIETAEMQSLLQNYLVQRYDEQAKSQAVKPEEKESTVEKVFKDIVDFNRIKFISDGVLAVVLTLLVLELHGT
jgi:hypothetical protein